MEPSPSPPPPPPYSTLPPQGQPATAQQQAQPQNLQYQFMPLPHTALAVPAQQFYSPYQIPQPAQVPTFPYTQYPYLGAQAYSYATHPCGHFPMQINQPYQQPTYHSMASQYPVITAPPFLGLPAGTTVRMLPAVMRDGRMVWLPESELGKLGS